MIGTVYDVWIYFFLLDSAGFIFLLPEKRRHWALRQRNARLQIVQIMHIQEQTHNKGIFIWQKLKLLLRLVNLTHSVLPNHFQAAKVTSNIGAFQHKTSLPLNANRGYNSILITRGHGLNPVLQLSWGQNSKTS